MNAAQFQKYHVNRRQWEEARAKRSLPCDAAALDALKLRHIGRVCSSKAFSQGDLDKMIAAFLAETQPANLDAQLDQQEQGRKRRRALEERIFAAGAKFITGNDTKHVRSKTISYACGVAKNLGCANTDWPMMDLAQLGQVMGIIERRAAQVARKTAEEAEAAVAAYDADPNPF